MEPVLLLTLLDKRPRLRQSLRSEFREYSMAEAMTESAREKLVRDYQDEGSNILSLFRDDPRRFENFSASLDDLLLDYSKTAISPKMMAQLHALAQSTGVLALRDQMFAGEHINITENRAVLH